MYRSIIISLCLFFATAVLAEIHEFMTPDGKSVTAEIVDFNAKLGQVTLKRQNGKRVKVKPAIFVEADQEYIKEWASLAGFRSESLFKISCEDKVVEKWKETVDTLVSYGGGTPEKETVGENKFERYVFELILENKNGVPLENLQFEYRIFYEQENQQEPGKIKIQKQEESGRLELAQLAAKGKQVLKTKPVVLRSSDYWGDVSYGGAKMEKESGEIKGIWLRISCTTESGKTVTRNLFEPAKIEGKYVWKQ